jgi:hypothetical protein
MKRDLRTGIVIAAALAASAACAHGNGASSQNADVRVVTSAQDVAGCEKLTNVKLSGTWTSGAGKSELEDLVRSKGGNVLLMEGGSSNSGVAYRCTGAGIKTGS